MINEMNYTTIIKKGESILLFIYKSITNKFTNIFSKLKDRFPFLKKYPLLMYSLIPLLITLLILLRYIINFVINELAAWTSGFVGETSGIFISDRVIVLSIATMFIILRIVLRFKSHKGKKANELELTYESTK